jgi:prevent-host-death family protein
MQISVKDAQQNLSQLLDRVESGEDILLTRDGTAVARIVSMRSDTLPARGHAGQPSLEEIQARVRAKIDAFEETSAARSQDFLYDELGLPK